MNTMARVMEKLAGAEEASKQSPPELPDAPIAGDAREPSGDENGSTVALEPTPLNATSHPAPNASAAPREPSRFHPERISQDRSHSVAPHTPPPSLSRQATPGVTTPARASVPPSKLFQEPCAAAPHSSPASRPTTAALDPARVDPAIVAVHQRFSPLCEQFRGLRARLISMNTLRAPQVIAVTSSLPREGKSVFSINLAFMLAEGGQHRIALIDADFRRRSIATMLGLRDSPGLADVLAGGALLDEVLQPTPFPNLRVIAAGTVNSNACGELLGRPEASDVLRSLREKFDYAILDTPAVLTVSDVSLLAPHCDGALLLVQSGRTSEAAAAESARTLQGNNMRILGCVLTRCEERSGKYYGRIDD